MVGGYGAVAGFRTWELGRSLSLSLKDWASGEERPRRGRLVAAHRGCLAGGPGEVPVWAGCPRGGSVRPELELPVVSSWHSKGIQGAGPPQRERVREKGREREKKVRITNTSRPLAQIWSSGASNYLSFFSFRWVLLEHWNSSGISTVFQRSALVKYYNLPTYINQTVSSHYVFCIWIMIRFHECEHSKHIFFFFLVLTFWFGPVQ